MPQNRTSAHQFMVGPQSCYIIRLMSVYRRAQGKCITASTRAIYGGGGRKIKAKLLPLAQEQEQINYRITPLNWTLMIFPLKILWSTFESQYFTGHFRKLESLIRSKTLSINDDRNPNVQFEITMNSNWKLPTETRIISTAIMIEVVAEIKF